MHPALEVSDVQAILTAAANLPLYQATAEPKHREKRQFTSPNQSQNWSFKKEGRTRSAAQAHHHHQTARTMLPKHYYF
jgi:predicted 2-oxoglutarate/Fe(II)-dependent dioxygenase YbiX